MNSTKKRVISTAILSAMLLTFTACGDEGNSEETTYPISDNEAFINPSISSEVRFDDLEDSTFRILTMEAIGMGANGTEDSPVGALTQEIYDSHRRCEERFGITITVTNHQTGWGTAIPNAVRQSANSGSNDYELVYAPSDTQLSLANEGLYLPIPEYDHWIDLEQPWWNKGYIDSVSVHSEMPFALFGSLVTNQIARTAAVFANVTKLEDQHNIVANDLFEMVLNDEWTLDKFTELVNMGYRDENGNTKKDEGDMFGLLESGATDWFAYSSGLTFTNRDEDGYPVLNLNNERPVQLAEKLTKLISNNKAVLSLGNTEHISAFGRGEGLFMANRLYIAGFPQLREMKDDFIILPYPKFDDTIDGYHSVVELNTTWGCVTSTVPDEKLEMVSAAVEQLCYDSYNNAVPLYYENDLKLKYTRGDDVNTQSQVLDLIVYGARTDFLFLNNVGEIGGVFSNSVKSGKNTFASYYAKREIAAKSELKALIKRTDDLRFGS